MDASSISDSAAQLLVGIRFLLWPPPNVARPDPGQAIGQRGDQLYCLAF